MDTLSIPGSHSNTKPNGSTNGTFNNNNNNNNNSNNYYNRNNLLIPTEVTFCNINDEGDSSIGSTSINSRIQRKRLPPSDSDGDSIVSSSVKNHQRSKIPDGGYGWVVVFASLMVSLIADGISFSFGLLYTEFLSYFEESKAKTAWIGSIFLAIPLLSGPVMSNLVDRYGCQKMTIIGGLMSGTGFVLAAVSNSVEMLYWTFGVIGGLGLGIGYVTAVVSIAFWFDKNRTFATGIGASGTGLGTFLYAPFTAWLIEVFGWDGCCLILAGTLFNICVFGSLMRDPEWLIENRLESRSQSIQTMSNSSVCLDEIKKLLEDGVPTETVLDALMTNYNTEHNQQISDPKESIIEKKYQSALLLPTFLEEFEESSGLNYGSRRSLGRALNDSLTLSIPKKLNRAKLASSETLNASEKYSYFEPNSHVSSCATDLHNGYQSRGIMHRNWSDENILNVSRLSLPESINTKPGDEIRRSYRGNSLDAIYENVVTTNSNTVKTEASAMLPKEKKFYDISIRIPDGKPSRNSARNRGFVPNGNLRRGTVLRNSNFLRDIRIHRHSIHYRGAMLNTHRYRLKASSCPNIFRNSMTTLAKDHDEKWYDSFVDIIKSIFDFSMFLEPKFASFNISTLLLFIWFIVPYFYLPEYMLQHNYDEDDSSKIISGIGVSNTIGMIVLGWAGDRPWVNIHKIFTWCLVVCGISCALMPLVIDNFVALMSLGLLFGITFASSFSFTPIILVRLVDLDDFTCAYGLVLLIQGIGNLVGPPIAGLIYEWTGIWDTAFYAAGIFIALSGMFAYITGYLEDREKEIEEENQKSAENCDVGNV